MGTSAATGTSKTLTDSLNGYQQVIQSAMASSQLDLASQQKLSAALVGVQIALDTVRQAPALVARIVTTPQGAAKLKLELAQAAYQRANDEASAALDTLSAVAESVRQQVGAALLPQKPAGISDVMLLDRKHDLERVLENKSRGAGKTPSDIASAAGNLLKGALADAARGDADAKLTAYVVAGGVLDFWYEAHGVARVVYEQTFANIMGDVRPEGTPSGVAVRALLGGGPNTLASFIDVARIIIFKEMQQANANLQRAPYTVQDNPTFPYNGPK